MRSLPLLFVLLIVMAVVPVAQAQEPVQVDDTLLRELFNHHADPTSTISTQTVGQMQQAWTIPTEEEVTHTPLVHEGRVYFADWGGVVYAADLETGNIIWQKQVLESVKEEWPWYGFTGTGAIGNGMLFEASVEGEAFALDLNTGDVLWRTRIAEDPEAGNIGKLLYYEGVLYVGLSSVEEILDAQVEGFEPDFQGKIRALNAETGEVLWTLPLALPPSTGATVWSSFALDPERNLLYFTTSNNYTEPANELSDAIVAVNATTGEIVWFDQVTEQDIWTMENPLGPDYAFGAGPQLFSAVIDGQQRDLVGAGQKSGVFYVWDRATGERMWTVTVGYGHVGGGIHGEASIGEDRIIIWGNNAYPYKNPEQHPMDIKAVDPATGNYLWVNPKAQPAVEISAGFLANDVYFVGSLDGIVRAYDAESGEKLWESQGDAGSVGSSLWVEDGYLLWGAGVPTMFGGKGGPFGLYAYRASEL